MKSSLLLSVLALSGCLVKMPGTMGGQGADPAAPAAPAAPRSPDAPASQPVGDLAPYYSSLTLPKLYHLIKDGTRDQIYDRAKADVGRDRLWQSANPDPAWILTWSNRSWADADQNAEAMTQAAFNRAWEASCVAEATGSLKVHALLASTLSPELARVDALTNYYERMTGYARLAEQYETEATANGLPIDKDPSGPNGFRVTILAHAISFHQQSRHAWDEFPWAKFPAAERIRRRDGGRELTTDAAFERARYCAKVASQGGLKTTPFIDFWPGGGTTRSHVAWPTVTGDARANDAREASLVAEAQAKLATKPAPRIQNVDKYMPVTGPAAEPKLGFFRDFKITAIKNGIATITRTDNETFPYACRSTNRIERIDTANRVIYHQDCKSGSHDFRLEAQLTFEELPPQVTLAVGDVISFHADVEKDATKVVRNTTSRKEDRRTFVLVGRALDRLQRGTEALTW